MSTALLLDLAVAITPDRLAVGRREDGLSFQQLQERVCAAAKLVRRSGARSLAFVGLSGPGFHVALFAAAHAGVALTPLSYRLAPDALLGLLDRLEAPLVVADEAYLPLFQQRPRVVSTAELLAAPPAAAAPEDVPDDAPAVVLFTSGTTSAPKGVLLRHENLISYVLGTVDPGSAGDGDAALVSVPPYHVAGVGTVLTNTAAGRRVVHLPEFSPAGWLSTVRTEQITSAMVVPTMLQRVVEHLAGAPAATPTLRSIAYGGARLALPVLERALEAFAGTGFVNAYGLTETSSTIAVLGPEDHWEARASTDLAVRARLTSVGRLLPGLDAQVRDVDPDGIGELWVRGPQVSGEYVGSGSALDPDGWFPTRDRARFDAGGYLFIHGRSDDTIIRGGENIAPAEIEDVLVLHPAVREVAVVGLPDEEWGERLVAAVVLHPGARAEPEQVRGFVRDRLRGSRTPDLVVVVDDLPQTPTGKLLRRELVTQLTTQILEETLS